MKNVKFNDNRSLLTKIADLSEKASVFIYKYRYLIFILLALGAAGYFEMEDQICKNPESTQCIEYHKSQNNK